MPRLNSERTRYCIAKVFNDDGPLGVRKLAEVTGIPYGTLRNAVYGHDQMALYRIVRIEEVLGLDAGALVAGDNDGVPDEPPDQAPQGPTKPPKRAEKAGGGPKRPSGGVSRGAA